MIGITLSNVTKRFGETVAVADVSLEVKRGELFFLLGPSGCGKTTLLRLIAGFGRPDSGDIRFDDRYVDDVPAHRRDTALVFQNYALWPHMTVAENVAYGLRERHVPKERREQLVSEALAAVHMKGYGARTPNQLSGGQQQRIALARALVIQPDAVLLDEPLSNLDAQLRLEMRREIRRIHDETGITMVYVTHDQKEALSMADRIAVMSMGRVEQIGDPRTLYLRPANRFVATFVGEANMIPGSLLERDGVFARVRTALGEFRARAGEELPEAGGAVDCMVRPECLHLRRRSDNVFQAVLRSDVYLGELEELVIEAEGMTLRALMANPGEYRAETDARIEVSFAAEDALLLPAAGGDAP